MGKYLDPKADLTFKRVFGEHENLAMSFLNALLPLSASQKITKLTYVPPELVPRITGEKNSIVDVMCEDNRGRKFIVEMQLYWVPSFMERVLFNASKIYVDQLEEGEDYSALRPVYSLNLVNDIFEKDIPEFYHYYRLVHEKHSDKILDGYHIIFVELPKFRPELVKSRRKQRLWLRFLTEISRATEDVPPEMQADRDVVQALKIVEQSGYSRAEMRGMDKYWDIIRVQRAVSNRYDEGVADGMKQGLAEGKEIGIAEGKELGMTEGKELGALQMLASLVRDGTLSVENAARKAGMSVAEFKAWARM